MTHPIITNSDYRASHLLLVWFKSEGPAGTQAQT